MLLVLGLLSVIGGFVSGLLGVGGAVVMIPMMLAFPPLLGVGSLTVSEVAGISMIQVLAASVSGFLAHRRQGHVHGKTLFAIGIPMAVCALIGACFSKSISGDIMLTLFGVLVLLALIMLLAKRSPGPVAAGEVEETDFPFNAPLSVVVGGSVGIVSGIIGAGGGFVLIPLMITVLRIPIKVTIGSSLGIVFLGALAGSVGKIVTMQVQWIYLLPILVGSIPAALVGSRVSKIVPSVRIRQLLIVLMVVILAKTGWDIVVGTGRRQPEPDRHPPAFTSPGACR